LVQLGLYGPLKKVFGGEDKDTPFHLKFLSGSTAGVLGSFVGNPFDVLKTLQMTNKGVNEGMIAMTSKLVGERGWGGLYRGVQANAMRACVLNGTKMACYDEVKGMVVKASGWKRNDLRTQFCAAAGAGFAMAVTVSPFDRMRTLLMNQGQTKQYSGFMDCLTKTVTKEGPFSLWRGFFPIWARFAPQATGQLIVFEFLRKLAGMDSI
jgi:hypothetical protein